jgi:hypothetical protein
VVGRTNTPEFGILPTTEPRLFGPTRNPWDPSRTAGGSSGGSAAAVAARMIPAALGSQTVGSTIRPAAFCGVVGFKPGYGRISRRGMVPGAWSLDHVGILTRTVADAALLLGVLAKGPPIVILIGGLWVWLLVFHPQRRNLIGTHPWLFLPLALLPLGTWMYLSWLRDDGRLLAFLYRFYVVRRIGGSVLGQTGPPGYHLVVLLISFAAWMPFIGVAIVSVAAPVYWDYQARVTRDFGGGERVSLFGFGSSDTLKVVAKDPDRGDIDVGTTIGFHRLIASWRRALGAWTSRLSPSYGYDAFSFAAGQINADFSAHVLELRQDFTRPLGRSLTLATGLDGELRFDRVDFKAPLPPERRTYGVAQRTPTRITRELTNLGGAAYLEAMWDLTPNVRMVPGLRFDWFHYNGTDKQSVDPRVVIRWARTPKQAFKAGVGTFHQPPDPGELDSQFGNPRLALLWSDQYHIGVEQGISEALSLDATVYYLLRHELPIASSRQDANGRMSRLAFARLHRDYPRSPWAKDTPYWFN